MKLLNFLKKNIKWRLTCIFVLLMVCCIGSILLFNTLFLERLYINQRKEMLQKTYELIDQGIEEAFQNGLTLADLFKQSRYYIPPMNGKDNEARKKRENKLNQSNESLFSRMLRELQSIYNISVVFVDEKNVKYSIFNNTQRFENRINSYIFDTNIVDNKTFKILENNGDYKIAIYSKPSANVKKKHSDNKYRNEDENSGPGIIYEQQNRNEADIECFGFLSDNLTQFFMTTPLMSIKEPVKLFDNVLILVSLIVIILGSIIIYITSSKITSPITKMAGISKKMSNMDFNTKCEVNTEDEIGILGNNMNEMSNKLEKTIKELKNANIMLKTDIEQKEKLDNMRTEFIANVSHELKTPIALIEGYAEGLEGDIVETKEDRDFYVKVIKDEAQKMSKMVMQLLDLMELEKEIDDVSIERINLYEIVYGVLSAQDILIKNGNINLTYEVDKNIFVWSDAFKLEEVITNYMSNAIHHVDDKKIIKLWVENIEEGFVRLNVYNTTKYLTDEQLENLWEKFYKVDKARTRAYGGTGLGLSIVKAIAKKLGCNYGCRNFEDGVVFYFDIHTK